MIQHFAASCDPGCKNDTSKSKKMVKPSAPATERSGKQKGPNLKTTIAVA